MPLDTGARWTAEQRRNAATIVQVGQQLGIGPYGIKIALATALQESGLRNLDYGDRDSLGLFQQRPSQGWGTPQQVRDPAYAAKKFYSGLQGVKGWENMPLSRAAQAVQRSAYPDAYAKWEGAAGALLTDSSGTTLPKATTAPTGIGNTRAPGSSLSASQGQGVVPLVPDLTGAQEDTQGLVEATPGIEAGTAPGIEAGDKQPALSPSADQVMEATFGDPNMGRAQPNIAVPALPGGSRGSSGGSKAGSLLVRDAVRYVGTPYSWGGTDLSKGVDCSGFVQSVFKRFGVSLPRYSFQQAATGQRVPLENAEPGDLIAWDDNKRNAGADHVAIYLGGGQIVEAPQPGMAVRVRHLGDNEGAWAQRVLS